MMSSPGPASVEPSRISEQPQTNMVDVMVAAVDVPMGGTINDPEIKWVQFPAAAVPQGYLVKADGRDPTEEVKGSIARYPFVAGEPMRHEKLIKGTNSGFLSAVLPSGKRAMAIKTEGTGETSAGGFILPNDFVDVVRVARDEEVSKLRQMEVFKSETVISNVRVLAIGQNIQERNGEKFITGQTATLELDPRQAEQIVLAQRVGTLSLSLRSLQDASKTTTEDSGDQGNTGRGVTVVRFGQALEATVK